MGRAPCCDDKAGLKKGAWTAEEDEKLVSFIQRNNGHGSWKTLPKQAGLQRCGKSCRLRWTNYLRPNIKRGNFSPEEERLITQLHALVGNRWSNIASQLPGRTDNEVKNHWNTHLKKRLSKMGIDPATHLPITKFEQSCYSPHNYNNNWNGMIRAILDPSIISHMAQWELARMEAEARLLPEGGSMQATPAGLGSGFIDYLIMRRNCTPRDEINVPAQRAAQHSSYVTLQNWEDALRMNRAATTPLRTQEVVINGTDRWDLDLDCMIACSPSFSALSSSHDFFQSFQGGLDDLAHPLEPSALSSGTAITMPAHDYGKYSLGSSHQNISTPESSDVSLLSDLLTPANGDLLALSNSTQLWDDNHDNWANMLDLVDPFMPCHC